MGEKTMRGWIAMLTAKRIRLCTRTQHDLEYADEMSFLLWQAGDPGFQPPP